MDNITGFDKIKGLRNYLITIFNEIDTKINALGHIYTDMVKTHLDKNYTLGLDSFYFQNKLIQIEYDNMKTIFNFIDNRIYCEYYKLLKLLYEIINKEIKDKSAVEKLLITHKHYPVYKDLEPSKQYDFNITSEINNTINNMIQELKTYVKTKQDELAEKKKHSERGINIDTMIHEQKYTIILLEERIHMFENYLNTFGAHHSKYFSRLIIKVKLMLGVVNEDFHLKKSRSLDLNRVKMNPINTLTTTEFDALSTNSESSSGTMSSTTPTTAMDDNEENNVRLLVGDIKGDSNIKQELDTILSNIPENEEDSTNNQGNMRNTIKRSTIKGNTVIDI
jgi:hypothetical protein